MTGLVLQLVYLFSLQILYVCWLDTAIVVLECTFCSTVSCFGMYYVGTMCLTNHPGHSTLLVVYPYMKHTGTLHTDQKPMKEVISQSLYSQCHGMIDMYGILSCVHVTIVVYAVTGECTVSQIQYFSMYQEIRGT